MLTTEAKAPLARAKLFIQGGANIDHGNQCTICRVGGYSVAAFCENLGVSRSEDGDISRKYSVSLGESDSPGKTAHLPSGRKQHGQVYVPRDAGAYLAAGVPLPEARTSIRPPTTLERTIPSRRTRAGGTDAQIILWLASKPAKVSPPPRPTSMKRDSHSCSRTQRTRGGSNLQLTWTGRRDREALHSRSLRRTASKSPLT